LRGGGGGNFGVVVSLTFRNHEWPINQANQLLGGSICWTENIENILTYFNEWAISLPYLMTIYPILRKVNNSIMLCLTIVYNGNFKEGWNVLQPLFDKFPYHDQNTIGPINYFLFESEDEATEERTAYIKSGVIPQYGINKEFISICLKYYEIAPHNRSIIIFTQEGGLIDHVRSNETAFPHRGHHSAYQWQIKSVWTEGNKTQKEEAITWAKQFGEALTPFFTGAYLNYIDPLLENWQYNYYKENYPKLVSLKKKYDANNFFSF